MKLCYRGAKYDYTPPVLEITESEVMGQYRGLPYHFSYVKHMPFPQPEADLRYRGVTYHTNRQGQVEAISSTPDAPPETRFRPVFDSMAAARRSLLEESARIHQENIHRSLQRRMEVAQAKGDETLVRQLEEELHQLV
jgi:hypothetical protein